MKNSSARSLVMRYLTYRQPAELVVNVRRSTARKFAKAREKGGPLYIGATRIVTLDDRGAK